MPQKEIVQVGQITNVKIGAHVEKRRGLDPQVVVTIGFAIPGGDVSKLGPLMDLEIGKKRVTCVFLVTQTQAEMDLDAATARGEAYHASENERPNPMPHFYFKSDHVDGKDAVEFHFIDDSGVKTIGKGTILKDAMDDAWKQFGLPPGNLPAFLNEAEIKWFDEHINSTADEEFGALESASGSEAIEGERETVTEEPKKTRGRHKKVDPPAGGNHNGHPSDIGTETGSTEKLHAI